MSRHLRLFARALVLTLVLTGVGHAQIGYGVNANGILFRFDVTLPGSIPTTSIGNLGFTPEAIDFKPGTNQLYALDVGTTNTQIYTVDINTGAVTPTSANFPSVGAGYNLTTSQHYGFDFNPSTHDGAGDFLIRLTATNGDNLRLSSATGALVSNDTDLTILPNGNAAFVDASAYLNNVPNQGTFATRLYDMDTRSDALYRQDPPNAGTLTQIGAFGAGIDANVGIGFDIYTLPGDTDDTIVGDSAYAVLTRNATNAGAYMLYQVDLTTGSIFNGKLVGPNGSPADFTGGFAIAPLGIPEPTSLMMLAIGVAAYGGLRARRS